MGFMKQCIILIRSFNPSSPQTRTRLRLLHQWPQQAYLLFRITITNNGSNMVVTDRISCSVHNRWSQITHVTQIIPNQPIAINAHKRLNSDNSMKGIPHYILSERYHWCIALQSKKVESMYSRNVLISSQSDPSVMISNLKVLYICSHTRKWSKSASPLDIF